MSGDAPIGQLLSQLVDDGKRYARAEIDVAKARVGGKVLSLRPAAIMAGMAAALMSAATTVLLMGLILALSPRLGVLGATALVVVISAAIACLLAYLAWQHLKKATK